MCQRVTFLGLKSSGRMGKCFIAGEEMKTEKCGLNSFFHAHDWLVSL